MNSGERIALHRVGGFDAGDFPIDLAWSPRGDRVAVAGAAGGIAFYDLKERAELRRWRAHAGGLHRIAWHPSATLLASAGQDGHTRVWTVASDEPFADVRAPGDWVEHLAWRSDGRQLAFACGRELRVCSTSGAIEWSGSYAASTVSAIAWRPGGSQIAAAGYGGVQIYDTNQEGVVAHRLASRGVLTGMRWSPDGRVVAASCQDNAVHFWRLREGSNARMAGFPLQPKQLDWSSNSKWLATGGGDAVSLWPFDRHGPEGCPPVSLESHKAPVSALAFAPGAPWLASGCRDGALCLWRLGRFDKPVGGIRLDARIELIRWGWRGSGALLAVATQSGRVDFWQITKGVL